HKARCIQAKRRMSPLFLLPDRVLALIEESPFGRGNQLLRCAAIIAVIRFVSAGDCDRGRMVKIIIPDCVQSVAVFLSRLSDSRILPFILGNHDDGTRAGSTSCLTIDFEKYMQRRVIEYLLSGVEPQAVEVEFLNPIRCIRNK